MTLKAITFLGDHQLYENADPGGWGSGDPLNPPDPFLPPDWQDVNSADNPVCYTRNTGLQMSVLFEITSSGVETPTIRALGPDGILGSVPLTVSCGTSQRTVSMTTSPLPDVVNRYEPMTLQWAFQRQGESTWQPIGNSSHDVFVSFGTPAYEDPIYGLPTPQRMRTLCGVALDAGTALEVLDGVPLSASNGIHKWLDAQPPEDGNSGVIPPWNLMWDLMAGSPYTGECHQQAHLFNLAIRLIGAGAGTEYLTLASSDLNIPTTTTLQTFYTDVEKHFAWQLGITQDLDLDGAVGNETLILLFDFNPPNQEINNFEGSVAFGGKYYAVWPSLKGDSACELLSKLALLPPDGPGARQYWIYYPTPEEYNRGARRYIRQPDEPYPQCP